jgi:hypothetical protein
MGGRDTPLSESYFRCTVDSFRRETRRAVKSTEGASDGAFSSEMSTDDELGIGRLPRVHMLAGPVLPVKALGQPYILQVHGIGVSAPRVRHVHQQHYMV